MQSQVDIDLLHYRKDVAALLRRAGMLPDDEELLHKWVPDQLTPVVVLQPEPLKNGSACNYTWWPFTRGGLGCAACWTSWTRAWMRTW